MRALNVLLAFVVSLVIGLAVLELGLRFIPGFAPPPTLNTFDKDTGWAKVPGKSITRRVGTERIHFDINEHGLRDDEDVGPGKDADAFRVLMLGDSFVLGYTVNRTDLFVDQLEGWWKSEGRRVDVVNTGTEGWSTDQEVSWFLENARAYEPNLVLLFPYENDIYWNGQASYANGIAKPLFPLEGLYEKRELQEPRKKGVLESSATVSFLKRMVGWLGALAGKVPPMNPEFGVLLNDPPSDYADWCKRTGCALANLRDACAALPQKPKLYVCPIPSKSAIDPQEREFFRKWNLGLNGLDDNKWSPDRPVELFLQLAAKLAIPTLDPRAALADATKRNGKLYYEEDVEWHFNAAGNLAFAQWLHDELDRREEALPAARNQGQIATQASSSAGLPTFVYVFAALWTLLGTAFCVTYPKEPKLRSVLSVGGMLAVVFTIVLGGGHLTRLIPHQYMPWITGGFVVIVLGFVAYKLGRRLATVAELLRSFTLRGHWYLMPLIVVLLTIGSLLVVAASSPLIAPFIYTLF